MREVIKERVKEPEQNLEGIAFLFPGQGVQAPGMGRTLYETSYAARTIFQEADQFLGFPISEMCFNGSIAELGRTEIAQAGIGTVSIAAHAAAQEAMFEGGIKLHPVIGAGISFGELPNLVVSGVIDLEIFFHIIRNRSKIMEEVGREQDGGMRSIVGLRKRERVDRLCQKYGVSPAIYYPGMTVISGVQPFLDRAASAFEREGAIVKETGIMYPFHHPVMIKAEERFRAFLDPIPFRDPLYPVVMNATGTIGSRGEEIKRRLPDQLTKTVDGIQVMRVIHAQGARLVVEFGPRPFLSRLVRLFDGDLKTVTIDSPASLEHFKSFLVQTSG